MLCGKDECGCSPRSLGHEPEGQQIRNKEGNEQLSETQELEAQC